MLLGFNSTKLARISPSRRWCWW